jgi:hypothetical protein
VQAIRAAAVHDFPDEPWAEPDVRSPSGPSLDLPLVPQQVDIYGHVAVRGVGEDLALGHQNGKQRATATPPVQAMAEGTSPILGLR